MAFLEQHQNVGIVGCWGFTIDTDATIITKLQYPLTDQDIRRYLLIENCFIHSGILLRKKYIDEAGGYDNTLHYAQDYDLWLRIGEKAKLANMPEFMVLYRKNPQGISKTYYRQQIAETICSVKKHATSYPFKNTSLLLWKIRLYIPYSTREFISESFRKLLFYRSFQLKSVL